MNKSSNRRSNLILIDRPYAKNSMKCEVDDSYGEPTDVHDDITSTKEVEQLERT